MPPNFSLQPQLDSLSEASRWTEVYRKPARTDFGMDETEWTEFLETTETNTLVHDLFAYELQIMGDTRLLMMQTVFNGEQIANRQQLQINFGQSDAPADLFAACLSPTFRDAKIQFNFDPNDKEWRTTDAMCMNVPFYDPNDDSGRHEFTPAGTELIECLLQQKGRLLSVTGLASADHSLFERMLEKIEKDKSSGNLHPAGWMNI